jgi:hypothetical protein
VKWVFLGLVVLDVVLFWLSMKDSEWPTDGDPR